MEDHLGVAEEPGETQSSGVYETYASGELPVSETQHDALMGSIGVGIPDPFPRHAQVAHQHPLAVERSHQIFSATLPTQEGPTDETVSDRVQGAGV